MGDHGVTIPKEVYKRVFEKLTERYKRKFGQDSTQTEIGRRSKEEYVSVYEQNLAFWMKECPDLEQIKDIEDIARYAICSNSIKKVKAVLAHLTDE